MRRDPRRPDRRHCLLAAVRAVDGAFSDEFHVVLEDGAARNFLPETAFSRALC